LPADAAPGGGVTSPVGEDDPPPAPPGAAAGRAPRRPRGRLDVRAVGLQVAALVAVAAFVAYLADNVTTNQRLLGIDSDFDYLDRPAGVRVAFSDFSPGQPVRDILLVGVKNTALVALPGIVLTLVLGTLLGIARLSPNWLLRKAATLYVETLRNIPPVLVIIFVNAAVVLGFLPGISESFSLFGLLELNNRQLTVASPVWTDGTAVWLVVVAAGVLTAVVFAVLATRRALRTGVPHRRVSRGLAIAAVVAIAGYAILDRPLAISRPTLDGTRFIGGAAMSTGYFALLAGLVLYTASHIAEIVRGSVQAVAKGQVEAADALGLSTGARLRFVVLPQAFRIAIPPTLNQFLNLTKNTSLGLVVAYSELTLITQQVIGNGSPAVQSTLVLMAIYLCLTLPISALTNVANRRLQLVER
jgi:general L-amino acid transport system permease protein